MFNLIDGKLVSKKIKDDLKVKVSSFNSKYNEEISLAVILVGENAASKVYVNNKIKACEYVGIKSITYYLPTETTFTEIKELINNLNNDSKITGILVQLPLPKQLNERQVLSLIDPNKDVDGFSALNVGNLLLGEDATVACTPYGILRLLKEYNIELNGKNAVVVGRSNIVGKPMAILLLKENCTVTICHSKTVNLRNVCKNADILIVAIGKPFFIKKNMVKKGAIVVDVGINRTEKGLKGDVDFENVKKVASFITPVPGGVGPMTIAMLLENTYKIATRKKNNES